MTLRKRAFYFAGGMFLAMVISAIAYYFSGSSAIESWIASQLLQIGGGYLQPQMHFDRLTYHRPRTVVLDNLTLTSPDPAHPGHSVVILAVRKARLELTEIPRRGQPIKFSDVLLESPEINLVAASPTDRSLLGFSHMLKDSGDAPATPSTPAATSAAAPLKLSDWLLIRRIEIKDGKVSYHPRTPDSPPIWLDGINAALDFKPSTTAGDYTLATTISRKPAFDLDLQGHINIDTLDAQLAKLNLTLDLQEKNAHVLPPDLQNLLKTFELTGQLRVTASGAFPLAQWKKSSLQATLDLTAAQIAVGQNRLAIDSWNFQADMNDGIATLRKSDAKLLGGQLQFAGTIPLDGAQRARLSLKAADLRIQKLLRTVNPDEPPLYAGKFAADINFAAPVSAWNKQASGGGTFSIRDGRIGNIPVIGPILTAVSKSLKKAMGIDSRNLTDSADGSLSFAGNGVRIDRLDATAGAMALRGTGTIGFDTSLDLRLNAGPLERLQNSLGAIGQAWASVSDAVAGYRVSGKLADPRVTVEIGGP